MNKLHLLLNVESYILCFLLLFHFTCYHVTWAILHLSSSPVCHVLLPLKGLVLPTSSPAAQANVCSSSGCVMDGTTALMEQMNMAVTTPPILPSVRLLILFIIRISLESQKMSKSNTLKIDFSLFYSHVHSFLMRGHRSGNVSGP